MGIIQNLLLFVGKRYMLFCTSGKRGLIRNYLYRICPYSKIWYFFVDDRKLCLEFIYWYNGSDQWFLTIYAYCIFIYPSVHKQLIRTILEGRPVANCRYKFLLKKKFNRLKKSFNLHIFAVKNTVLLFQPIGFWNKFRKGLQILVGGLTDWHKKGPLQICVNIFRKSGKLKLHNFQVNSILGQSKSVSQPVSL